MKLQQPGEYLKAKDVRDGEKVTFLDEGCIETSDKYKYENSGEPVKSLIFKVDYKTEQKKIKVVSQSKGSLIEAWGDETKNWIGKTATIFVFPAPNGKDKMIVLKPITDKKPEDIAWEP